MMPVLLALVVSACNGGDGADTTVSAETAPTNPNAIRSDLPEDFPIPIPRAVRYRPRHARRRATVSDTAPS
jgi:hypothetical protein